MNRTTRRRFLGIDVNALEGGTMEVAGYAHFSSAEAAEEHSDAAREDLGGDPEDSADYDIQDVRVEIDILPAQTGEDSHGTAPLGWNVYGL